MPRGPCDESQELGVSGAARFLTLSEGQVRQLADRGDIPTRRTDVGYRRFSVTDLEKFVITRTRRELEAQAKRAE